MLTMITEVFGVRGDADGLILYPKLLSCQFDADKTASVAVPFADKNLIVIYKNENRKDFGSYIIDSAWCNEKELAVNEEAFIRLPREMIASLPHTTHTITVNLL